MNPAADTTDTQPDEETILFSVSCLRHMGLFAYSGVLELTPSQLHFRPFSTSKKVASNKSILIPTTYLRSARIFGSEEHLFVQAGREKFRFSGLEVHRFYYRLCAVIADIRNLPRPELPEFAADERVLAFGSGVLILDEERPTPGEVLLTNTRLRFFAYQSKARNELNPIPKLHLELPSIQTYQLQGITQKLAISSEIGATKITGSLTATLFALLSNLCRPIDSDNDGPSQSHSRMAKTGPATRIRGPRRTHGLLVVGGDSIQFVPAGIINILLGARPIKLSFEQLTRTTASASRTPRLVFQGAESSIKLRVDDCEGWFTELTAQIQDWLENRTQAGTDGAAGSRLGSWRFRVNRTALEDSPLVLPVVYRNGLSMDSMILATDRGAVRLAGLIAGPDGAFLTMDSMEISRIWDDLADDREILFHHKKSRFALIAAGGAPSVENFWERCRTPSRVFSQEQLVEQNWSQIIGPAQSLKVIPDSGATLEIRPSRILKHSDGLAMVVQGVADECAFLGQNIEVHFSHSEGMCEMETLAIWASSVPNSISIPNRKFDSYMLLVVELPQEIRAFNARRSFRVPAVQRVSLIRIGHPDEDMQNVMADDLVELGETFDGTMLNIAAMGCAVLSDQVIDEESRVRLTLTIEGRALPLSARVVRRREVETEESTQWEYGLAFIELDRIQTNTITKAVRQVQLHILSKDDIT